MRMVVCRFCDKIIRMVGPAKASGYVNGVCKDHYDIARNELRQIVCKEIVKLNKTSDCLEACLASLHPKKEA